MPQPPPRVLFLPVLFQAERWNGIMEHLRILIGGLGPSVVPVLAVRPSDGEQTERLAAMTGVEVCRLTDSRTGAEITGACRRERIGLVHVHSPVVGGVPKLALGARRGGARVTVTWHQVQLARSAPPRRWSAHALQRICFPRTAAVSRAVRDSVVRDAGLAAAGVCVIYNGVEPSEPGGGAPPEWLSAEATWCAYVGRLAAEKGVERALRALAAARETAPSLRLAVIGDGYEREHLEALARELDLGPRVVFAGHREDARALMRRMAFLVHPPDFEGLPYSLIEATEAGLPVVATNAPGGIPEVIEDGVNGLLVAPGDNGALADAMVRMTTDAGLRERLAAGAHARYLERFTAHDMVDGVRALYEAALGRALPAT